MIAVVLTCDRYAALAEHMVRSYERWWPEHPFRFRVAYQSEVPAYAHAMPARVEARQTPTPIRGCVLSLIEDLRDDAWVYWAIDDKYPTKIDVDVARDAAAMALSCTDERIAGISIARMRSLWKPKHVKERDFIEDRAGRRFIRRGSYKQFWAHQWLRAGVIRRVFEAFPDRDFRAKEMDAWLDAMKPSRKARLYVSEANHIEFGESTTRGQITANAAESMVAMGISLPSGFEVSSERILLDGRSTQPL